MKQHNCKASDFIQSFERMAFRCEVCGIEIDYKELIDNTRNLSESFRKILLNKEEKIEHYG